MTAISVNECEQLRDEGVAYCRLLLDSGEAARCRQVMDAIYATETFQVAYPDVSRDTTHDLAPPVIGD